MSLAPTAVMHFTRLVIGALLLFAPAVAGAATQVSVDISPYIDTPTGPCTYAGPQVLCPTGWGFVWLDTTNDQAGYIDALGYNGISGPGSLSPPKTNFWVAGDCNGHYGMTASSGRIGIRPPVCTLVLGWPIAADGSNRYDNVHNPKPEALLFDLSTHAFLFDASTALETMPAESTETSDPSGYHWSIKASFTQYNAPSLFTFVRDGDSTPPDSGLAGAGGTGSDAGGSAGSGATDAGSSASTGGSWGPSVKIDGSTAGSGGKPQAQSAGDDASGSGCALTPPRSSFGSILLLLIIPLLRRTRARRR